MAQQFFMQAVSDDNSQLYTWTSLTADFVAAGFPGPGDAIDVAVLGVKNDGTGGGGGSSFPPGSDLAMAGHGFTGARDPVAAQEFATKSYTDGRVRSARVTAKAHADSPYAVLSTDEIIEIDTSTGTVQLNLPDPALRGGYLIADVGLDAGTNNITLHRHGSEKIIGATADKVLSATGATWFIWSNGTNWWISGPV